VDERGAGCKGVVEREDAGQLLVLDLDQIERGRCRVPRVGGDGDDGLAGEAHLPEGEDRLVAQDRPEARFHAAAGGDLLARQDGVHPRRRAGTGHVEPRDARVRSRAPKQRRVKHPRHLDVDRELDLAGDALARVEHPPEHAARLSRPAVGHAPAPATSVSARATQTRVISCRYHAEPRMSSSVSIDSA
jgi:hypothetical protein